MHHKLLRSRFISLITVTLFTVIVILGTRFFTLLHNSYLHPDEHVFYEAAESLTDYILGLSDHFYEIKEYPEGAITMQLPFHLFSAALHHFTGFWIDSQICGRIASVSYFTAGVLCGFVFLRRYAEAGIRTLALWGIIESFSLIHIEQSRYGTGESISFFLLMCVIILSSESCKTCKEFKRFMLLLLAGFLCGILCAVKYPLIVWFLIPVILIQNCRFTQKYISIFILLFVFLTGFFIASPKTASDPLYIVRVLQREMNVYVFKGNQAEMGGPINHLFSVLIYWTIYAGFPLAPVFLIIDLKKRQKKNAEERFVLFQKIVPTVLMLFCGINFCTTTLFMRAFYPLFFISDLYVADLLGSLKYNCRFKSASSIAVILVLLFFICRGLINLSTLSKRADSGNLKQIIELLSKENPESVVLLGPGFFLKDSSIPREVERLDLSDNRFEDPEIKKGELIITANLQFYRGSDYVFPVTKKELRVYIDRWREFKKTNERYLMGKAFPTQYYYLFGYWIKGTTGSCFEFPECCVYYR